MKISHTQLETCRANPLSWLAAGSGRASFGYAAAVKLAIFHFHSTGAHHSAQKKLEEYLDKFSNHARKQWARETLDDYVVWSANNTLLVADTKPRISLSLSSDVLLSGEMSRVGLDPSTGKYEAILFVTEVTTSWTKELRWPLIQIALAQKYSRDASEISVGVQELNGANLQTRSYSGAHLFTALSEAQGIAAILGKALK